MLWDPTLRTLYRLVDLVEGEDLARVQEEIARRRALLEAAEESESPLSAPVPAGTDDPSSWEPQPTGRFRPSSRDETPRLVRRPGERKNRVAPPAG